jgi:hypothetical protein
MVSDTGGSVCDVLVFVAIFGFRDAWSLTGVLSLSENPSSRSIAKHFIVDDICAYIGSQNLYICDLAEWGVVIDDEASTKSIKSQYWDPMWKVSYTVDDCEVDKVMDGLKIDRSAPSKMELTKIQWEQAKERIRAERNIPASSLFHAMPGAKGEDLIVEIDSEASSGED